MHSPVVFNWVATPNLSLPALQYLSVCITAHRAGGERLGETTTGEWCPFSVGYIFFGSYQYYHHDSNDDKLPQDMNYDVKVTRAIDFPSLKKQVKKTMKTKFLMYFIKNPIFYLKSLLVLRTSFLKTIWRFWWYMLSRIIFAIRIDWATERCPGIKFKNLLNI